MPGDSTSVDSAHAPGRTVIAPSPVVDTGTRGKKVVNAGARVHGYRKLIALAAAVGLVLLVVALLGAVYHQSYSDYKQLKGLSSSVSEMIDQLSQGIAPSRSDVNARLADAERIRARASGGSFGVRLVGKVPYLGRPIQGVRLVADAVQEEARAVSIATSVVEDLLGKGSEQKSPVFADGAVNTKLILSLPSRLQSLRAHVESGQRAITAIRWVPFVHFDDLKTEALQATSQALKSIGRSQSVIQLLPGFLGFNRPRTYLLLLQNPAQLRGTGGSTPSYALITAQDGKFVLEQQGDPATFGVVRPTGPLPRSVAWYLRAAKEGLNVDSVNFSPDFPAVAQTWRRLFSKVLGLPIDGAIVIDPAGVAEALNAKPSTDIQIGTVPTITAHNVQSVLDHEILPLPKAKRERVLVELIGAAFQTLIHTSDPVGTLRQLSTALAEGHMKIWSADDQQAALFNRLGWDGSIEERPGDRMYLVQNNLLHNDLDSFSHQDLDCTIELTNQGSARSSCLVKLTNDVPPAELLRIRGGNGVNTALMSLYIPRASRLQPGSGPIPLQHVEGRSRVLSQPASATAGKTTSVRFTYTVANVVTKHGEAATYAVTIQTQSTINPPDVVVRLSVPPGTHILSAPGWSVKGSDATLHFIGTRIFTTRVTFE
jgi:hypothetical protein